MKSVGIIVEYNPFHNGHLYHLNETKKKYKDHTIIAVMSGNFTQRGDTSIINKQLKTLIALNHGIDIVVELPFQYATQSADIFAKGAIEILNNLKTDVIMFGSESNDIKKLKEIATKITHNKEYEKIINNNLSLGNNYPKATLDALNQINNTEINTPNDILGICYIKEILKNKYNIEYNCIKRTNDYHDLKIKNICSASSIRNAIKEKKDIKKSIPQDTYKALDHLSFIDNYYDLLKYKILSSNDLSIYQGVDEGIENRINKYILISNSLEQLIKNIKTKRYSYNKIKRMLTHILIGYTKEENKILINTNYIRVLGFTKKGQKYLNKIKKDINIPLITNYTKYKDLLYLDYKATCIYSQIFDKEYSYKLIKGELNKPIIK